MSARVRSQPAMSAGYSASRAHYSAWTPVNHLPSNEQLFQERKVLVGHWFDMWSTAQRCEFLGYLFEHSTTRQRRHALNWLRPKLPAIHEDFTVVLPRFLSLYIFSFLDPRSLCRAAAVSWHWHFLTEQDVIWMNKCTRHGWYLPYAPTDKEYGAWKGHYVSCLRTLDISSPNKQIAMLYNTFGSGVESSLSDGRGAVRVVKKKAKKKLQKKQRRSPPQIPAGRVPWLDPDPKPNDSERGWKAITTGGPFGVKARGLHHSTFSASFKAFAGAAALTQRWLRAGRSGNSEDTDSDDTEPNPDESFLVKLSEVLQKREISMKSPRPELPVGQSIYCQSWPAYTSPFRGSLRESLSGGVYPRDFVRDLRPLVQGYPTHAQPRVVILSSQVPATELLVDSIIFGVLPLIYDYHSSTLRSLILRLDFLLAGRQAKSIALFVEGSPGEINLIEGQTTTSVSLKEDADQQQFWEALCGQMVPAHHGAHVDIFMSLASCARGLELIHALQQFSGVPFSSSRSISNSRDFVTGEWIPTPNSESPPALYFNQPKLKAWSNTCSDIQEALDATRTMLSSFFTARRRQLVCQLTGRIVFEALQLVELAAANEASQILVDALVVMAANNPDNKTISAFLADYFYRQAQQSTGTPHGSLAMSPMPLSTSPSLSAVVSTQATRKGKEVLAEEEEEEEENEEDAEETSPKPFAYPDSPPVSSRMQHRSPRLTHTSPHRSPSSDHRWVELRQAVANEILSTEVIYHRSLSAVHELFHIPLKNSADAGRPIVRSSTLVLVFTDTDILLSVARSLLDDLKARIESWTTYQCLGDVFLRFTTQLQAYINFTNNYGTTLATIERSQEESPAFRAFLKQQCGRPETQMLDLFGLLLLPGKRIQSYIHLLHTLKVHTPADHPDHPNLDLSLERLEQLENLMAEARQRSQRERRLEKLQQSIVGVPLLQEGNRHLIAEETFAHLKHAHFGIGPKENSGPVYQHVYDVGVFLFTDSIIITGIATRHFPFESATSSTHHYLAAMALESVGILNMPNSKYLQNCFTLVAGGERWVCRANSAHTKFSFLSAIQKAIDAAPMLQT